MRYGVGSALIHVGDVPSPAPTVMGLQGWREVGRPSACQPACRDTRSPTPPGGSYVATCQRRTRTVLATTRMAKAAASARWPVAYRASAAEAQTSSCTPTLTA